MSAQHTPGPWFLSAAKKSVVARPTVTLSNGEERWTTRRIARFPYNDNVADAYLIAASPDLFDALEKLIVAVEFEVPPIRDGVEVARRLDILERIAREAKPAIAKSLGRTPNEQTDACAGCRGSVA